MRVNPEQQQRLYAKLCRELGPTTLAALGERTGDRCGKDEGESERLTQLHSGPPRFRRRRRRT